MFVWHLLINPGEVAILFRGFLFSPIQNRYNMAKIILGGLVTSISGSIGGTTYQKFKNFTTARRKPICRKNPSIEQSKIQSINGQIITFWQQFDPAQRNAWNMYALFRQKKYHKQFPKPQTGYDLFRFINFYFLQFVGSPYLIPHADVYNIGNVDITAITAAPDYRIELDRTLDPAIEIFICKMTRPISPALANPGSRLRCMVGTTTNTDYYEYENPYVARFGMLPETSNVIWSEHSILSLVSGFIFPFSTQQWLI